jgi:hypothetical protein
MSIGWRRYGAGLLAAMGLACGDPLVGPEFVGTPELSIQGGVEQRGGRLPVDHGAITLGVFWIRSSTTGATRLEQETQVEPSLAAYTLRLFDAPPAEALRFADGQVGLGVIVLYADRDGSGAFERARDLVLGAAPQHVVAYARDATSPVPGQPTAALPIGYSVLVHDVASRCAFSAAELCRPEGGLAPTRSVRVPLVLWDDPSVVVVPAPALGARSVWVE